VSAVSLIAILFQYVNYFIKDPLEYGDDIQGVLRRSIATIIIVFPVYVLTAWFFHKEEVSHPDRREIKIRKWLVYLTLFISAITVIVDLVTLVYKFLGGELSPRFGLKVLAVLVVAAGVFWYYLWDLRRPTGALSLQKKTALRGIAAVIAGIIIGGFFLIGSPASQRLVRFDQQRITDLQYIQQEVINNWQQKEVLPADLAALTDSISGFSAPLDPETKEQYGYTVKSSLTFELCANFITDSKAVNSTQPYRSPYDPYQQNWEHGIGETCFSRTIDPELYRNRDNGVKPLPAPVVAPVYD
jgi:heme/copper-type cytochrome/quinol oxidase subunit 2